MYSLSLWCRNSAEESVSEQDTVRPSPPENQPTTQPGETEATEGQDANYPGGTPVSGGATQGGQSKSPVAVTVGGAGDVNAPKTEGARSPEVDEKSAVRPAEEEPASVDFGGGAGVDNSIASEKATTDSARDGAESSTDQLGSKQQQPSGAAKEQQQDGPAREPGGDAMDVAEEPTAAGEVDSSDEEDEDDGFKVVVGREVAPAVTPVVPTKRFLRGEG